MCNAKFFPLKRIADFGANARAEASDFSLARAVILKARIAIRITDGVKPTVNC